MLSEGQVPLQAPGLLIPKGVIFFLEKITNSFLGSSGFNLDLVRREDNAWVLSSKRVRGGPGLCPGVWWLFGPHRSRGAHPV